MAWAILLEYGIDIARIIVIADAAKIAIIEAIGRSLAGLRNVNIPITISKIEVNKFTPVPVYAKQGGVLVIIPATPAITHIIPSAKPKYVNIFKNLVIL